MGKNEMEDMPLSNGEPMAEFNWEGNQLEVSYGNWVSSDQGFFYWEDIDENILLLINDLFNVKKLQEIQNALLSN